ncbi:MAG TPA: hypothetical protein VGS97_05180 [Actinocrinis sp.]|uniref:hypothetical protein n=1 Tax=Actinocrinis sp. TaxID=1920516 RepID=UPI002DDDAE88|nr:hypothetical protein [Actinocrinis sp.]HEV2343466.1 hypothetical protein [Actinocrinis sp.]
MTMTTLAPAAAPDPADRPGTGGSGMTVPYETFDALVRAALATLAADARGLPNPLGYLRDALPVAPRPGAHPHEYVPCDDGDAVFGRW